MNFCTLSLAVLLGANAEALTPGDHTRSLMMGEEKRSYIIHVPQSYDPQKPTPVVLSLHGAAASAAMQVSFCGLNKKSEEAGFVVVYPNGTAGAGVFQTWNSGTFGGLPRNNSDDVGFIGKLLDELPSLLNVDKKRIYVTGMSNGAMMTYRLAAEMSERIAAIAPVAGTMTIAECNPKRPVPVMHFHGTEDALVPFRLVEKTATSWAKVDGCPLEPVIKEEAVKNGDLKVTRKTYGPGKDGAEVIVFAIEGGGHTWPGQKPPVSFLGKSALNLSANDLMWEFFKKHPLKD